MNMELKSPYWSVNWTSVCTFYNNNHIDVLAVAVNMHQSVIRMSACESCLVTGTQISASHPAVHVYCVVPAALTLRSAGLREWRIRSARSSLYECSVCPPHRQLGALTKFEDVNLHS